MANKSESCLAVLIGDEKYGDLCRTFVFQDEGHTLGNALRSIIIQYPDVQFCGYTIPHPSENNMHFRIQSNTTPAVDILKRGLEDLRSFCQHVQVLFETEMENFRARTSQEPMKE